jgi:hypothetical protein
MADEYIKERVRVLEERTSVVKNDLAWIKRTVWALYILIGINIMLNLLQIAPVTDVINGK